MPKTKKVTKHSSLFANTQHENHMENLKKVSMTKINQKPQVRRAQKR